MHFLDNLVFGWLDDWASKEELFFFWGGGGRALIKRKMFFWITLSSLQLEREKKIEEIKTKESC